MLAYMLERADSSLNHQLSDSTYSASKLCINLLPMYCRACYVANKHFQHTSCAFRQHRMLVAGLTAGSQGYTKTHLNKLAVHAHHQKSRLPCKFAMPSIGVIRKDSTSRMNVSGCSMATAVQAVCGWSQRDSPVPQSDYFWSVGFFIGFEIACQAIVTELQAAFICQQQIGQLEITVHYPAVVEVVHDLQQLRKRPHQ